MNITPRDSTKAEPSALLEHMAGRVAKLEQKNRELCALLRDTLWWLPKQEPVCPVTGPTHLRESIESAIASSEGV